MRATGSGRPSSQPGRRPGPVERHSRSSRRARAAHGIAETLHSGAMGRKRNGKNRSASRARSCREQAGTVLTNGSIEFWKRATKSHDAPRGCEMLGGRTPAFQPAPMPRNRPQLGVPFQVATGVPFLVAISKTDQPFREGSAVEADGISPRANGVELRR